MTPERGPRRFGLPAGGSVRLRNARVPLSLYAGYRVPDADPSAGLGTADLSIVGGRFVLAADDAASREDNLGGWIGAAFDRSAAAMGLPQAGTIAPGAPDAIVFEARDWIELFSQPQSDRLVIRDGRPLSEMNDETVSQAAA